MEQGQENVITPVLIEFLNNESGFRQKADDTINGLCLNGVYLPEDILVHILALVDLRKLLRYSLVCWKWNNLIKSYSLWTGIYKQKYNCKAENLPWYLYYCLLSTNYFDTNLLRNGNGQDMFNQWKFMDNGVDDWVIEDPPVGSDLLPLNVPEFNSKTSCFATLYSHCYKFQVVHLGKGKLFRYILDTYKPYIYISEWVAARVNCRCTYKLQCGYNGLEYAYLEPSVMYEVPLGEDSKWKKVEILVTKYPKGIRELKFKHECNGIESGAGYFGSKMAGGVVKLLFDSIKPLEINHDRNGKICNKI